MTFETSKIKRWLDGKLTTYTQADFKSIDRPGAIYTDPQGCIWFATRNGLLRFQNGTFEELTTPEAQSKLGLVQSLFTDREGNVWVGTEANALVRLRCVAVRTLTAEDGLSETSTRCVYRDRRGDIWIGAYLGFARLSQGKMTTFNQMDGNPIATVTSISEDSEGRIWIGSGGRLYTVENERLVPIPGWTSVFDIKVMACDGRGDMWIGTDGDGLYRYSDGKFTAFRTRDGLANNQIRALLSDRQGALWVGTTAGLSRYQDGQFTNFTVKDGMANGRVMSLCQDTNGVIWLGTRGGLIRYQDGHFFNIHETEGLPNNYVFNVLDDGQGNFWLSSGSGICHVRRADLDALAGGKTAESRSHNAGLSRWLAHRLARGRHATQCRHRWRGEIVVLFLAGFGRGQPRQPGGEPADSARLYRARPRQQAGGTRGPAARTAARPERIGNPLHRLELCRPGKGAVQIPARGV